MKQAIRIPQGALLTFSLLLRRSNKHGISSLLNRSEVKNYLLYSYGRIALLDGLRILACEEGSNVLLPSYFCGLTIEPFHELGIEARIYAISLNLQPDIKDIKKDKTYQFLTPGVKTNKTNTDGMIQNPITGKWSFL